jgi:Rrf2 family protein
MLSRTSEYALRAMIHLAGHADEWPISGQKIARATGIPSKYLSKILGDLVRGKVLASSRGKAGGFRMVRSPERTSLHAVLTPFEQFVQTRCMFGNPQCTPKNPCLAHKDWQEVLEMMEGFFKGKTVYDIAVQQGERGGRKKKPKRRR